MSGAQRTGAPAGSVDRFGRTGGDPAGEAAQTTGAARVELREMRWWDIEPVLELEQRLFEGEAWTAGMLWSELAYARGPHATRRYLLVVDSATGATVGYGGLATVSGTGNIQTIGVVPGHRRAGSGALLLRALLTAAAHCFDCHEVFLEVRVDNASARRLYERFGFTEVGIRRGYYQPGNIDALVMRLTDPGAASESGTSPHGPAGASCDGAAPDPPGHRDADRARAPGPVPPPW